MENITYTYEDIKNGNYNAIHAELIKQSKNLDSYENAVFADDFSKEMCLPSLNGIKKVLEELSDICMQYGYNDLAFRCVFFEKKAGNIIYQFKKDISKKSVMEMLEREEL